MRSTRFVAPLLLACAGGALACPMCILEEVEMTQCPNGVGLVPASTQPGGGRPDMSPIDWRASSRARSVWRC